MVAARLRRLRTVSGASAAGRKHKPETARRRCGVREWGSGSGDWRRGLGLAALAGVGAVPVGDGGVWPNYGHAEPGEIGFQKPVTDLARYLQWFHNDILMPVIIVISLFVLALLAYVVWRFNEKANPVPSKTTHNTLIEVAWTIIPVIILVFMAIPSFRLLTMQLTFPPADLTVKVMASQWHWNYGYPKDAAASPSIPTSRTTRT